MQVKVKREGAELHAICPEEEGEARRVVKYRCEYCGNVVEDLELDYGSISEQRKIGPNNIYGGPEPMCCGNEMEPE